MAYIATGPADERSPPRQGLARSAQGKTRFAYSGSFWLDCQLEVEDEGTEPVREGVERVYRVPRCAGEAWGFA